MDVFGGAPRFLAYPRPVVVQSGTDAVLKCQIGGDPRPAVIWERNNEKIDPQGRYRVFEDGNVYNLIISAVVSEDSGQYICKAKNSIGETYAAATLKVEGEAQEMEFREENKPLFLIKPLSTRVGRGEDAVFSCKLWGNPRPEVAWEKDGRKLNEIFESTHFSVGYQDGGWFQLKIFKTRAPDGGVYTCKARNGFGEALAGAVLLVDAGPGHEEEGNRNGYTNGHWKTHQGKQRCGRQVPNRLRDDSTTKSTKVKMFAVTEGKHAKFRCFVTGKPKPEILWRKDGRLILSGRRYLLYEDREGYFTLKVLYCKQKDNGVYVCAASNTAGQTLSAVHLSVKEPPVRFKQPLIDLEVWERDLAILECEVPEDSVPITWYLEDRRLQPGAKYGMEEWGTKRRLTIRDIGVDDDGIYLCEMPDGGRSIAEVAVKGTILRKLPRKVDVLEGENAAFCVEVEKEEMDIHWYKDGMELRETHQTILKSFGRTHILVFVNTNPQDSGLVTFLVGRSKTSSQLRVKAARHCPPSCPVGVQINTERANAALLSWVPAQDTRKNPPSGYVLERQEVGTGSQEWLQCLTTDSATSVEILGDSVPCEADYRFRICSVNKYGKSNNVEFPRTVHLVPVARIQAPLQDALVPEGQDAVFSIELSASVIGTWFLNGTQLQEDERYSMRRSRTHQSLRIRGVRDTDNGAEITFIAYGIRDSAALYIQAPLVKFSPLSEMDRNKFVEIGNPIVLYCELSDPAAPVHWYKNGVELQTVEGLHIQSEGTMRRIVIQSAEFTHSGVYCCDAIDDVIRFNVEVEAPPVRFSAIPDAERNKTIYTGSPIVLQCELSDPTAQVHWYKDGSKLHPQNDVDIISDGLERKLIIHCAEDFHSGLYSCKTRGDTVTFNVDIKAPPVKFSPIPEEMRTKSIKAGCPIDLQCVVSDPEAPVSWYKDEIQLTPNSGLQIHSVGDTRTLVIQSAELSHSGVYRCTTQDDTVEFQVEIKAIPVAYSTIFDIEKTKSLEVGKPLELECEVADASVPVCWYKDGKKLVLQSGWDIQTNATSRKLIIPSAELLHSGLYSCETSDDTFHFTVDIKAPTLPLSPSPEVVEMQTLEEARLTEPTRETSDSAFLASRQQDTDPISIRESDFELGGIKKTLVIEPTHPSNSGAYYCATADDVAQLIVKNEVPSPTCRLERDVEKVDSTEAHYQIVQQFEISDPIAKACWYKDGTQIYPKKKADCKSYSSSQILPLQSQCLSGDGRIDWESSDDDEQLNEDMKGGVPHAEQCHFGGEIGEIADASAQYTVDVKAASPRLSSDEEKSKSAEEVYPVEVVRTPTDVKSDLLSGKEGNNQTFEDYSGHMPNFQSAKEYMTDCNLNQRTQDFLDNQQITSAQSPMYCNSVKSTTTQSDTHHHTKPTELQGEEIIHYVQHADPPTEELRNSLQSAVQADESCDFIQNENVVSGNPAHKFLIFESEELSNALKVPAIESEPFNSLQALATMSEHDTNTLHISTNKSDMLTNAVKVPQLQDPFDFLHTTNVESDEAIESIHSFSVHSKEPLESCQISIFQTEEHFEPSHIGMSQSDEHCKSSYNAQVKEPFKSLQPSIIQSEHPFKSLQTATAQTEETVISPQQALVELEEPFKSIHKGSAQSEQHVRALQTSPVQSEEPFRSLQTRPVQSEEFIISHQRGYVQLEDPTKICQNTTIPLEEDFKTSLTTIVQSEESFKGLETSTTQTEEYVKFSQLSPVQLTETSNTSESSILKSEQHGQSFQIPTELLVETFKILESAAVQSDGSLSSSQTATIQSEEPFESVQTNTVCTEETCKSSHSTADQSEEPFTASEADMQSEEHFKALQNATMNCCPVKETLKTLQVAAVQSTGPSCSIQMTAGHSEELQESLQTENVYPVGSFSSSRTTNDECRRIHAPLQETTLSETLTVFPEAESLETLGLSTITEVDTSQTELYDLRQSAFARLDDPDQTGQTILCHSLHRSSEEAAVKATCCHTMETKQDQEDRTFILGKGSFACFADPFCSKEAATAQSEEIYLSRICESHWRDSVTANKVAVEAPPVTITTLCEAERKKSVGVGESVALQCEISDPKADVTWYKDGIKLHEVDGQDMLSEGSIRSLTFQSVALSHAGTYSCRTTDDAVQFHVDVKAVPQPDQTMTLIAGSPTALQCEQSDSTGSVSWYKDGVKLLPESGVDFQSEENVTSLVAPSAEEPSADVCQCESKDDDIQFAVEVKALPAKFSELEESDRMKSVQEGAPILLSCRLAHDTSAHVDWYKDGLQLLPQNSVELRSDGLTRTLLIPSAESVHAGTYECSTPDDTVTFNVDVQGRSPQIMPIPVSEKYKMISVGCPIMLQCEVSDPLAQVSWSKDEVELFCKTGLDMKRHGTLRKLIIHSAKASDSGQYDCKLNDDVVTFHVDIEGYQQCSANLITPPAPSKRFAAPPEVEKNKYVEAGSPIKQQRGASEPAVQVYWQNDEEQLLPKTEYEIQRTQSLREVVNQSVDVRHVGTQSCEAADDHIEFKVDVAAVPEVERSKSVEAGSLITLQSEQREISRPTSHTRQSEDAVKLPPESRISIDSESNQRTMVQKSDTSSCSGVYSYKSDDDDDDDSDFNDFCMEVKVPPVTFVEVPEKDLYQGVVEQEQLILSCEVSRADGLVQWYKDGTEMQSSSNVSMQAEGTKRILTIRSSRLSDTGTYTCRSGDNMLMFKVNIREPPVMITHPKEDVHLDRHVPEEIILSCELSRPNGAVSWYKDGQKLQESENIKLKIEGPYRRLKIISSRVEDSGEYVCDTADDSIFFQLSITEPPVQIVSPSQSQMELCQQTSERMVLSCEISRPNAVVRWYRDGLEVEENDNLILEVDGVYRRLIIPETTVKDSAEYVCDTADDSVTFFVNIAEPPVRFVRPRKTASKIEKMAGEALVLDCEVSRSNAEVTWKKNGEEVEDSRNVTILEDGVVRQLTIHCLTEEYAGQYICDAKDDVMDFTVKVQELPVKILGKPDAKTEKQFWVSDDIILVCELSRVSASVQWYKDSRLIGDTERYCCEEQGVFHSLVVLNAGLEDSGEYTCDAVDDQMVFYITVKEPPVQIIGNSGNPEHHMLVAGDDLILECEVSRPNATVQWLRNGAILKPDTRVQIYSHDIVRKLVLSGLRPSDSGKYICDAIDDKLITIVEVQEPPVTFVNKTQSNNVCAYENESVTLRAIVSCDRANVRWLKDGQLLNADNIHISSEGNTHKLTINPLQLSDSGEYVCDANTDEMFFSLLVKEMKVRFIRRLENVASVKGSGLTLLCEVNKAKGDVQWLKGGQEISPSRRYTIRAQGRERSFTIHQLVDEDAGEYSCESTDDRTSATVTLETPRVVEFVAELRNITVCEGEDAVFKCVVSPADTKLVWRLNDKQVALNERAVISSNGLCHMLCINNCMVSDSGRVTADAEGLVSEAELQVQEQQVLFTKKMTPVVAEEYSEATLEVEVSVESDELQWMRQGVLIHPGAKYTLNRRGRKHSLTIHKLAMSDRGAYSCETLHDRTQAQLTVEPRKITIKRGLSDAKTTERETASFEVEISHPNVPGTWTRNGIQLKPTNHFRMSAKGSVHSLTISNLSVEDTGTFVFCVENQKTSARLVVKEPPVTVVRKLQDRKFPEGAAIALECELSRHNVDVKWMKNGVELKPSRDMRIYAMGRKRFLQVMKCHVSDSGVYACDAGDVATSCAIEVYERELLILQALEDVDIQEDQNAVFVCEISVEDVPGEWYKNGERIQPTSTVKIRQEGTKHFLLMCNVRAEDSGQIKFVARHVESVASLEVEELPVNIVKPLEDKTALEKTRVVLDCTVSNPRCSIRWYKGCNVVLPSERFEICSEGCYRKLVLQQVAMEDDGTYSVQVGEHSCSARLTVEAQSLLMVRELKDVEVTAPDEACFECEVSVPVLTSPVWSLNGEQLRPSARVRMEKMGTVHRLTFRQTSTDMSGEVEFSFGKMKSSAQLRVVGQP